MNIYETRSWAHKPFIPVETAVFGAMHQGFDIRVVRLSVNDGGVQLEWLTPARVKAEKYKITVTRRGETVGFANNTPAGIPAPQIVSAKTAQCKFEKLVNGIDHEVCVFALDSSGKTVARSLPRLFRTGCFPGTVVNYIHPDDYTFAFSGRSPASPFILKLPSGSLLVSHDVYWQNAAQNLTVIFRSDDGGKSWKYVTDICPCFWGKLFYHRGSVYLLGMDGEYGSYLIGRSDDEGYTWSNPVKLLDGGNSFIGGPHQAPTPVLFYKNRVWTAVEYGAWRLKCHKAGIISADLDGDLLDANNWVLSPFVEHDPNWENAVIGGEPAVLEGNLFVMPDGKIGNLLRYHTKGARPEYGRAVLLTLNPETPAQPASFHRIISLCGNTTKFFVQKDEKTGQYMMLCNRPDNLCSWRRDVLSLAVSEDGEQWSIACDLLNYRDNNWPEGCGKTGLQYPSMSIENDDLLAVVRTALNGAWNFHNANTITFHRFTNFRDSFTT